MLFHTHFLSNNSHSSLNNLSKRSNCVGPCKHFATISWNFSPEYTNRKLAHFKSLINSSYNGRIGKNKSPTAEKQDTVHLYHSHKLPNSFFFFFFEWYHKLQNYRKKILNKKTWLYRKKNLCWQITTVNLYLHILMQNNSVFGGLVTMKEFLKLKAQIVEKHEVSYSILVYQS